RGSLGDALYWALHHHDMPHGPLDVIFWERLEVSGVYFALSCFPLLAAAGWSLGARSRRSAWAGLEAERVGIVVPLASPAPGVPARGGFSLHYFPRLLPAWCLGAAPAVAALLWREGPSGPWPLRPRAFGRLLAATALVFFAVQTIGLARRQTGSPAAR